MKKRFLLVCLALCLALSACSGGGATASDGSSSGDSNSLIGVYAFDYIEMNEDGAVTKYEIGDTWQERYLLSESSTCFWLAEGGCVYVPLILVNGDKYGKGIWSKTGENSIEIVFSGERLNAYCDGEKMIIDLEIDVKLALKKASLEKYPIPTENVYDGTTDRDDVIVDSSSSEGDDVIVDKPTPVYEIVGDYLYFGEYPQTLKASDIIITQTVDARGYYMGSDGKWYAKVTASPYLPNYKFANGEAIAEQGEYYFAVEPIKWQIIENDGQTVSAVCVSVLANHKFAGANDKANSYKDSSIRRWLNNEFYLSAFTAEQQAIILTTSVDNSAESTGYADNKYACANTEDKIYLLSFAEAFAFTSSVGMSELRAKTASDYARANGVRINTSEKWYGYANWWLRSPYDKANSYVPDYYALYTTSIGSLSDNMEVIDSVNTGVVPALQITIV